MGTQPVPHPLMTPRGVAGAFGVSLAVVWRWGRSGHLACLVLPDNYGRYFRAEVEALQRGEPLTAAEVARLREELASRVVGRPADASGRLLKPRPDSRSIVIRGGPAKLN